jgi:hypothetical protein
MFMRASRTREECESYGTGCRTAQSLQTGLLEQLNASECVMMGGLVEPFFEWKTAHWISGKLTKGEWLQRDMIIANELKALLNFTKMASYAAKPVYDVEVTSLQNEVRLT